MSCNQTNWRGFSNRPCAVVSSGFIANKRMLLEKPRTRKFDSLFDHPTQRHSAELPFSLDVWHDLSCTKSKIDVSERKAYMAKLHQNWSGGSIGCQKFFCSSRSLNGWYTAHLCPSLQLWVFFGVADRKNTRQVELLNCLKIFPLFTLHYQRFGRDFECTSPQKVLKEKCTQKSLLLLTLFKSHFSQISGPIRMPTEIESR